MADIRTFSNKSQCIEDTIPPEWKNRPTPKNTPKRPVGRPRKTPYSKTAETTKLPNSTTNPSTPTKAPKQIIPTTSTSTPTKPSNQNHPQVLFTPTKPTNRTPTKPNQNTPTKPATNTATPSRRGKYRSYILKEKREIVEDAKLHGVRATALLHGVKRSTLMTWMKTNLGNYVVHTKSGQKAGTGRSVTYGDELDQEIVMWILHQQEL